jgi:phosphorylcholine metabolism protein LicD
MRLACFVCIIVCIKAASAEACPEYPLDGVRTFKRLKTTITGLDAKRLFTLPTDENHVQSLVRLSSYMSRFPLILHGGTLIGGYFNGMPLPWDSDLDFGLLADNEDLFVASMPSQITESEMIKRVPMEVVRSIRSSHKTYWADDAVVCYCDNHGEHHIKYRCYEQINWFFADILVYHLYNTNVVSSYYLPSTATIKWGAHKWPEAWVFPLHKCTFANVSFFCPRNIRHVLTRDYGSSVLRPKYDKYHFENGCWIWKNSWLMTMFR